MNRMTLLLSRRLSSDSTAIRLAAIARGWSVERVDWQTEGIENVTAIYGETLWSRVVASRVGRVLIEPPLDWLVTVPYELRDRHVRFGTLESLQPIKFPTFLKPADDKRFAAGVHYSLPPRVEVTCPALVSEIVQMGKEYRVWILNGAAVTAGAYIGEGESFDEAMRFAEECAKSPRTPPALVIDVANQPNGAWCVVEANPVCGSGVYSGADPDKILDVLAAACVTEAPEQFTQKTTIEL